MLESANYNIIARKNTDNLFIEVINKDTNKHYHKKILTDDITNQYITSLDELYQLFQVGTNNIKPKNPNNYITIHIIEDEYEDEDNDEDNKNLKLIIKYDMIIKFEIEIILNKVETEDEHHRDENHRDENYRDKTEIVELKKTVSELKKEIFTVKKNLNFMSEIISYLCINNPQYNNYISKNKDKITHLFMLPGNKMNWKLPQNNHSQKPVYIKHIEYNYDFRIEEDLDPNTNTEKLIEYKNLKELYLNLIPINLRGDDKIKIEYLHIYKLDGRSYVKEQISNFLDKFEISTCINIMYIINIDIILIIHNKYNGKIQIKVFTDGEFINEPRLKNLDNLLII